MASRLRRRGGLTRRRRRRLGRLEGRVFGVRLFFVLTAFAGGFAAILYIILWAITPEARNSADRLAMKGEPINVHNIARKVEEEIDDLTHKFDNWREKRRMRKKNKWRF